MICGSRQDAIGQFRKFTEGEKLLLVDSERAFTVRDSVQHLQDRGDINADIARQLQPGDVFLMVETMENWLIADIESIAAKHQTVTATPALVERARVNGHVEHISKAAAEKAIAESFPSRWPKGKRMHLVGLLRPETIRERSPEAERLFACLYP